MAITLESVQEEVARIAYKVDELLRRETISGNQVIVTGGLSEIDDDLGLVTAGEFRAGNGIQPGLGFSGVRIGYPAFQYGSDSWHIVGVNSDTMQFGLRASDGVAVAGGGTVTLGANGISIAHGNASSKYIKWDDTSLSFTWAYIYGIKDGTGDSSYGRLALVAATPGAYSSNQGGIIQLLTQRGGGGANSGITVSSLAPGGKVTHTLRTSQSDTSLHDIFEAVLYKDTGVSDTVQDPAIGWGARSVYTLNQWGVASQIIRLSDASSDSYAATLEWQIASGGALSSRLVLGPSSIVFNPSSVDVDIRFKGTGDSSLLVVDWGADAVYYKGAEIGVDSNSLYPYIIPSAAEVAVNDSAGDVDFRIESDTNPNLFLADAGLSVLRTDDHWIFKEKATPATPAAGYVGLFGDTDGLISVINDTGGVTQMGTGGGGDIVADLVNTEVSITDTATATISKMHVCSGTTANYTVTLPAASGNSGKLLGIRIDPNCTKLITIDGNLAETIDGEATRIMWAGESCILKCDGSNWHKISGKSIPFFAVIQRRGSDPSIPASTWTPIDLTVLADGTSLMHDTSNSRITIPRPGLYQASGFFYGQSVAAGSVVYVGIGRNAISPDSTCVGYGTYSPVNTVMSGAYTIPLKCSASDYLELCAYHTDGTGITILTTVGGAYPQLGVLEVPQW